MTTLVLSDIHLAEGHGHAAGAAAAALVGRFPGAEVVLAGDVFDLSLERAEARPDEAVARVLGAHGPLLESLQGHMQGGGKLTLIVGNHDAALADEAGRRVLTELFAPPDARKLDVSPWFVTRGDVHIEHGHLFDPDCAPDHPLAPPSPHSEGLGTALMRRFVAPNDALFFAHAHETTPLGGLRTAFERWGASAPLVIARYFHTALALCAEALSHRESVLAARAAGDSKLGAHASSTGQEVETLAALLSAAPRPTHHDFAATFRRLYFDRIFAGCALGSGGAALGAAALAGGPTTALLGGALVLGGGAYLASDLLRDRSRYSLGPGEALAEGARLVREITGSRLVVFGHTHVAVTEPGYMNLGSFGFAREGRPYLLIDDAGRTERAYF